MMPLFAVSDVVLLAIVTGFFSLVTSIIGSIVTIQLAKITRGQIEAAKKVAEVAVVAESAANKVEDVRTRLDETTAETKTEMTNQFNGLSVQIEEVHKSTNGMTTKLVEAVKALGEANTAGAVAEGKANTQSAFEAGVKSETDKQQSQE